MKTSAKVKLQKKSQIVSVRSNSLFPFRAVGTREKGGIVPQHPPTHILEGIEAKPFPSKDLELLLSLHIFRSSHGPAFFWCEESSCKCNRPPAADMQIVMDRFRAQAEICPNLVESV